MIKLIIFDWDDVFTLGSKEGYVGCLHQTLVRLGIHVDPEEEHQRILAAWSKPHREELRSLLKEHPELLDRACDIYEDLFFGGEFVKNLTLVEGSRELLERLHKKYILAVATGAHPKVLKEEVFTKFNIPNVFAQIMFTYEIDDAEHHKPHPYMVNTILQDQNDKSGEAVFVGDAGNDVAMAQSAHVKPIVVLTGHLNRKQAEELGVKYIIDDVSKLEDVLKEL
jgi:phosphoglycolate phosphatase-like HAD superfamily hydrolase